MHEENIFAAIRSVLTWDCSVCGYFSNVIVLCLLGLFRVKL